MSSTGEGPARISEDSVHTNNTQRNLDAKPALFDLIHSRERNQHKRDFKGRDSHPETPLKWRHLCKHPVIRQCIIDDVYVTESAARKPDQFEPFFDLVIVSVFTFVSSWTGVAIQATTTSSSSLSSGWAIYAMIVFYYLAWSVWQSVRSFINVSGTDDIPQRVLLFLMMALLLGIIVNSTGIGLSCGTHVNDTSSSANGNMPSPPTEPQPTQFGADCQLAAGWQTNVRGLLAFYLIAKAIRIGLYILYGLSLPRFRRAHFMRAFLELVGCILFLPLMFKQSLVLIMVLPIVAIILETSTGYFFAAYLQLVHYGRGKLGVKHHGSHALPAQSLDHAIERMSLFMILVVGELVASISFSGGGDQAGAQDEYGRCVMGLLIGFNVFWLYYEESSSRTSLHALRRNRFASVSWSNLHLPLSSALLLSTVALSNLVPNDQVERHILWMLGGSLGVAYLCMGLLATLHFSLDKRGSSLIPRRGRIFFRFATAAGMALVPMTPVMQLNSVRILAIYGGLTGFPVLIEVFGKIGAVVDKIKVKGATERRRMARDGHEESPVETLKGHFQVDDLTGVENGDAGLIDAENGEDDAGCIEGEIDNLQAVRLAGRAKGAVAF